MNLDKAINTANITTDGIVITLITRNDTGYFIIHASYSKDIASKIILLVIAGKNLSINYTPTIPALYYS